MSTSDPDLTLAELPEAPKPKPPRGLRAPGRRFWDEVSENFELDQHELALLREGARTIDVLDSLDAQVRSEGVTIASQKGVMKAHPALVEARAQRIALARLVAVLRLPQGEQSEEAPEPRRRPSRGPRRVGARGTYGLGPAS